jgi:N-acetylmuramoyl-L-alanine amidase
MAIKICLQAGHWSKGGGAPEEMANNKRITDRLAFLLRERGFNVYQTDWYGWNDPVVTKNDYDLFLALHCDMDYPNDQGGGFADYADPNTDAATKESQRICKVINDYYFPEVEIVYKNRSNANTRFYYMWKYLTPKTPCVLIEMGQSIDPHDKVLLANTELIAGALYRAICKSFNVSYEIEIPPEQIPHTCEDEMRPLREEIERLNEVLKQDKVDFEAKLALERKTANESKLACKNKIINFINSL